MSDSVIIIQARMNSSRFPGKVLAPLCGKPVIKHVIDRVRDFMAAPIVVATTDTPADDPLVAYLESINVDFYRGDERNVLMRFYRAWLKAQPATGRWYRITADCPLLDGRLFNHINGAAADGEYAGWTNSPDGTDIEAGGTYAMLQAVRFTDHSESEHVTTWMQNNLKCNHYKDAYPDVHYSVNTPEDLKKCELLIRECGEGASWQDHVEAYRRLKL